MAVPTGSYLVLNLTICLFLIAIADLLKSDSVAAKSTSFTLGRPNKGDLHSFDYNSDDDAFANDENGNWNVYHQDSIDGAEVSPQDALITELAQGQLKRLDSESMIEIQDNFPAVFKFFCTCLNETVNVIEGQELKSLISMFNKMLTPLCTNPEKLYTNIPTNFNGLNIEGIRQERFKEFLNVFAKNVDDFADESNILERDNNPLYLLTIEVTTNSKFPNFTCTWMEKFTHVFKSEYLKKMINMTYAIMLPSCRQLELTNRKEEKRDKLVCPSKGNFLKSQLVAFMLSVLFNFWIRIFIW